MIIAEHYFVGRSKEKKPINWVAMITWVIGTGVGYIALQYNFLVPAIVSMVVTFVCYILLSKTLDSVMNKDI